MSLSIELLPVLNDNYVYLLREPAAGAVAVVDPSVAAPVRAALAERGWRLTHILNTHHHGDHTGGNLELKAESGCLVVGPAADRARIPGIDVALADGDTYDFGRTAARVFDIPGHTRGHIAFWFEAEHALFPGDTLFSLGCGRLFEGTPAEMLQSLGKLARLPDDTRIYCGHEYTESNARFALTLEPGNPVLQARMREVTRLRREQRPTIPSTMGAERAANPFLRWDSAELRKSLGLAQASPLEVFAETRRRKDVF